MHFPLPAGLRRAISGPDHPVALYYAGMAAHRGMAARLSAQAVRGFHALAAMATMSRYAGSGTGWRDLPTCLRFGLLPRELAWASDTGIAPSLDLLPAHVKKGIDLLLNPNAFPLDGNLLLDKRRFDTVMRAAGLPLPQTFGADDLPSGIPDWARTSDALIFKPGFASQGRGMVRLERRQGGWAASNQPDTLFDLADWLRARMRTGDVAQQFLSPHPEMETRSPGALPTLRIITCLDEQDRPEVTHAIVRFGSGASFLDNFHRGGVAAMVDLASGRTGRAMQRDTKGRFHPIASHPRTGEAMNGFALPRFAECLAVARHAHETFLGKVGKAVSVGWDVALSSAGPMLIEGNWNPGLPTLQYIAGSGLGASRLGQLWCHHLKQVPPQRWKALPAISYSRSPIRQEQRRIGE